MIKKKKLIIMIKKKKIKIMKIKKKQKILIIIIMKFLIILQGINNKNNYKKIKKYNSSQSKWKSNNKFKKSLN